MKLLEVREKSNAVRGDLLHSTPHVVIARLAEHSDLLKQQRLHARSGSSAGKPGHGWRRQPRDDTPGVAALSAGKAPREETRTCFFCKKKGHLRANFPQRKQVAAKDVCVVEMPYEFPHPDASKPWNFIIDIVRTCTLSAIRNVCRIWSMPEDCQSRGTRQSSHYGQGNHSREPGHLCGCAWEQASSGCGNPWCVLCS